MKKHVISVAVSLAALAYLNPAAADELRFKGGIGVIPLATSTVRGVPPAGQIWVIADLDAKVKANGDITVKGKGLILGAGNSAGRATGQNVFATLICEAAAPFTQRNTTLTGVQLAANGDFRINDRLEPAPLDCPSPMLLIRNAAGQAWFAVGIPSLDDD